MSKKKKKATPRELTVAQVIYHAFCEGYNSYSTPACAYNTVAEAWDNSEAKITAAKFSNQMSGIFDNGE